MKCLCLALMVVLCTGCASSAGTGTFPVHVHCAASESQTRQEPAPSKPAGEYSQRDVALYIAQLHKWGARGWEKLAAVARYSRHCRNRVQGNKEQQQ